MPKIKPNKPVLIMMFGFPGAGKSHFAKQFCEEVHAAHVYGDKIRHELFEKPTYNSSEDQIVHGLMDYMSEEFLKAGVSVVYDTAVLTLADRRALRDLARRHKAGTCLLWLQIDAESAFARTVKRDQREAETKYANKYDRSTFDDLSGMMQNPKHEDYVVISGKHTFNAQRNAVIKKMYELGHLDIDSATAQIVKPELVNLVPPVRAGRVDPNRRNIAIR